MLSSDGFVYPLIGSFAIRVKPVFRNNKFTSNSGIPAATAARFTRALLESNIIIAIAEASGKRPALYSFEPLMCIVRV